MCATAAVNRSEIRSRFTILAVFASLFSFTARGIPSDGLIAHYSFEGNSASDLSGNGNHAVPQGNYSFASGGRSGDALRLNGDGSLFYAGGGFLELPSFDSSMNDGFTVSLWAKDESIGTHPVGDEDYVSFGVLDHPRVGIGLNNDSGGKSIYWYIDSGAGGGAHLEELVFRESVETMPNFTDTWKNLTLVYEPGYFAAYLNGDKIGSGSITFNGFPVPFAALGRHWWSDGFGSSSRMSVTLDDVSIYNRALSDAEIKKHFSVPEIGSTAICLALSITGLLSLRRTRASDYA